MEAEGATQDKASLRHKFKSYRREFARAQGSKANSALKKNLRRLIADYGGLHCALYRALPDEANCELDPLTDFYFPVVDDRAQEMAFWRPQILSAFKAGSLGVQEPLVAQSLALDLRQPAVICCPALAVDRTGRRLGLGRGFYDRFLARHPHMIRVAVLYQVQFSGSSLPADSWDQSVDWIVTEQMVLRTSTSTRSSQTWI